MKVEHLEVLVEEPSMEAALLNILPGLLGTKTFKIHAHQCKQDLFKHLPMRLRGYSHWLPVDWRIMVVVDRDNDNCLALKRKLENVAASAGLTTRSSTASKSRFNVVNRVVVEELESWYFGDWNAVVKAYPRVQQSIPKQAKYRMPDSISGGTWENLEHVLQQAGYFSSGFRKIEAAQTISPYMVPSANTSHSFQVFSSALSDLVTK